MRKTITTLLLVLTSLSVMAKELPFRVVGTPPKNSVTTSFTTNRSSRVVSRMSAKAGSKVDGKFTLNDSKKQFVYAFIAVPSDAVTDGYYDSEKIDATNYTIGLPSGTYDLMAIIDEEDCAERVILIKEDVSVSSDGTKVEFDVAEATHTTRISHTDSDGRVLTLPSYTAPHNCTCADFIDFVTHNGAIAWAGETLAYMECNYILTTNNPNSRFSFLRSDIIGADMESATMLIPVDFNKEVCGPTSSDGWQVRNDEFVTTPFIQKYNNYYIDNYGKVSDFTYLVRGLILKGEYWGSTGLGIFDMKCDSQRVAIWAPNDYDGNFDVMLTQISNVFSGDDSSVQGMFLMRSEDGLTQVGLNMPLCNKGNILARNGEGENLTRQFSRYSGLPQDGVRGNATPVMLACTDPTRFFFAYRGRYGEDMSLDSYNVLNSLDSEQILAELGGNPNDVKIYADGKLICSSFRDLPWNVKWVENADNRAEIEMNNVLIDGEIPGRNTAVIEWNAEKGNGFAPSFTSLQFRNTEDKITDRFDKAADGVVEFTVGDLVLEFSEERQYFYYDIDEVKSVSVEYAPHGNTDFVPIEVNEIPEMFFTPGYGYFYRGSLSGVDRLSSDGWFDLKLRAEDSDGAYVEQILSPAFKISSLTGVGKVISDKKRLYQIEGNDIIVSPGVRIFTPDGKQCSGHNMNHGVYIISDGNSTDKVVM